MPSEAQHGRDEYLVSRPEALRLVSSSPVGTEETALVVPQLPVPELRYHRALVDAGSLVEHCVVSVPAAVWNGAATGAHAARLAGLREPVGGALNSRKPTVVSFLTERTSQQPGEQAWHLDAPPSETDQCAALAAVVALKQAAGSVVLFTDAGWRRLTSQPEVRLFRVVVEATQ